MQKTELIQWLKTIEDESILNEIQAIRFRKDFDFEKEWQKGITIDEARKKSKDFIRSLSWEK